MLRHTDIEICELVFINVNQKNIQQVQIISKLHTLTLNMIKVYYGRINKVGQNFERKTEPISGQEVKRKPLINKK